jgi:hypothetical protein
MFFITKKTSKTGKRFKSIDERMIAISKQNKKTAKEIGFDSWRKGYWTAYGGFSSLIFKKEPDTKVYKRNNGSEWMPRLNIKAGKDIQKKLDAAAEISRDELNMCIGFGGAPFSTIGFARDNKTYYGFSVDEKWKIKVPKDCTMLLKILMMQLQN